MARETAAIIGGTGLIGSILHKLIQDDDFFETVRLLVRRPMPGGQKKTEVKLIDFNDDESFRLALEGCSTVFCAVGTTQKKVGGNEKQYKKIDVEIPVKAAHYSAAAGASHFSLVSAVGANKNSNNFYLKLKGEAEEGVQSFGIASVAIFQPSLLLGERQEQRTGERIAQTLMPFFSPLLIGKLSKYKPISAMTVAAAMLARAKEKKLGCFTYQWKEMQSD